MLERRTAMRQLTCSREIAEVSQEFLEEEGGAE